MGIRGDHIYIYIYILLGSCVIIIFVVVVVGLCLLFHDQVTISCGIMHCKWDLWLICASQVMHCFPSPFRKWKCCTLDVVAVYFLYVEMGHHLCKWRSQHIFLLTQGGRNNIWAVQTNHTIDSWTSLWMW
jgi:hypothetical protein